MQIKGNPKLQTQVKINKKNQLENVNIFLPISLNICLGVQKNRLIDAVLLSSHKLCFG